MKSKLFILLIGILNIILISLFFFSCGFIGGGGGINTFQEDSQSDGGPGNGDTPRLSSRLAEDSDLGDKPCEDNNRCKEACRDIYERVSSYKECYRFDIEKVSRIEDVFYILLDARQEDLEDIDEEDLETYINTGIDGWRDKVISKQIENSEEEVNSEASEEEKRADLYVKLQTTLEWIVQQEQKVVSVLEEQDRDNEILEKIVLEYCDVNSSDYSCNNASSEHTSNFNDCDSSVMDFDRDRNKELFVALSFVADMLFVEAMSNRRYNAFALGHELVKKACINRDSSSTRECVDVFYYRFVKARDDISEDDFDRHISNIEEETGEEIVNRLDCSI